MPMATIRKTPLARRAMVARLRLRRRAQARIARVERVKGRARCPQRATSSRDVLNSTDVGNRFGALGTARPTFSSGRARARERNHAAAAVRPAINKRHAAEKKTSALLRLPVAKVQISIPIAPRAATTETQPAHARFLVR